ncbi:MAG: hypothetical protein LWX83_06575 [Anaerolineae bacterium]|nr:hypothetical protein [Anaerolineae bacterium]
MTEDFENKMDINESEKSVMAEDNNLEEDAGKQRHLPLIIIPVVVIVLGLAIFFGMRLMNTQLGDVNGGQSGLMLFTGGNGKGVTSSISIDMDPAPELPETKADKHGVFVRRSDNSIFIGTGNIQAVASMGGDGKVNTDVSYDGPVIEVVITHDTQIFKDITEMPEPSQLGSKTVHLQQVVETGSLDEITDKQVVNVWGNIQGDRLIARVVLYH